MTRIVGQPKPPIEQVVAEEDDTEFLHAMALGEEFLEHHGIKGMKWGVRKAGRAADSAARIQRVAEGHGSTRDKAHALRTSSDIALIRNKGSLTKEAGVRTANIQARSARLAAGTATRSDKQNKNNNRAYATGHGKRVMTPNNAKLKIQPGDHPVTKQVKKDHNTLSNQEFLNKYATTKGRYRKRVEKHGDPYQHLVKNHPVIARVSGVKSNSGK